MFSKNDIKNSVKPVVTPSPARRRYQLPHQLDWIWLVTWPLTRFFFFLKISLFLIFYSKLGRFFLWSQHHLLCFVAALHLCHYQNSTYESVCMLCFLLGVFKHCFFFYIRWCCCFQSYWFFKKTLLVYKMLLWTSTTLHWRFSFVSIFFMTIKSIYINAY